MMYKYLHEGLANVAYAWKRNKPYSGSDTVPHVLVRTRHTNKADNIALAPVIISVARDNEKIWALKVLT